MTKNAKIAVALAVVLVLAFVFFRHVDEDKKAQWNKTDLPGGGPTVGVFGMDWG